MFSLDDKHGLGTETSGAADTARREDGGNRDQIDGMPEVEWRAVAAGPDGSRPLGPLAGHHLDRDSGRGTGMPSSIHMTSDDTSIGIEQDDNGSGPDLGGADKPGKRLLPSFSELRDVNGLPTASKRRKLESASSYETHGRMGDRRREDVDDKDCNGNNEDDDEGGVDKWAARCQTIGKY